MPLVIPDDVLLHTGLSERETRIEFACWLFDTGRLFLWPAAQLAGLTRGQMESELSRRKIAIYRPTSEDLANDLATLEQQLRN